MKRAVGIVTGCCFLFALRCGGPVAGGGTETTNGISGVVTFPDISSPIDGDAGIIAALYSIDYRPDSGTGFAESTMVASDGSFAFDSLEDEYYNLFILDTVRSLGAFLPMLTADTALAEVQLSRTGTVTAASAMGSMTPTPYEIIIPGTPFYYKSDPRDQVTIPVIPEGAYVVYVRVDRGGNVADIESSITVDPEVSDTTLVSVP